MSDLGTAEALNLLDDLLGRATQAGADAADAVLFEDASLSASSRLGKPEDVERSESRDLGLRVIVGHRQAFVSSTDWSAEALAELVERGLAMARLAPEDPYCGLAEPALLADGLADLDLCDEASPGAVDLIARAQEAEQAALDVAGVTNSEGAQAGWSRGIVALATRGAEAQGFHGAYRSSSHSTAVSAIAGGEDGMIGDYDYHMTRHLADLEPPVTIGRRAAERAVGRLGPRKVKSAEVPVIFEPRVAGSILGHLAGAINGAAVARGTSFLKDRLGEQVFAAGIRVVDDPLRIRGLRSKPTDGEGVRLGRLDLIEDGRLTAWLLDSATARQLDLTSNGRASRGTTSPPSPAPTNLYLEAGTVGRADLIGAVESGLYVTELIGFGVNGVTGDYSRGAGGFWIEGGELAFPVTELTIAGNLTDMFRHLTPADDLTFRHGTNAPTIRIDGLTVAGT